jgi:rhamnogalacturonan endolyase
VVLTLAPQPPMRLSRFLCFGAAVLAAAFVHTGSAQPRVEKLGRGVVAVPVADNQVYVGWRLLASDPADVSFNVYRSSDGDAPVKLNAAPISSTTQFTDTGVSLAKPLTYIVRPVLNGAEQSSQGVFSLPANAPVQPFLTVPLQIPADGTVPGGTHTYSANDASVGDLDGDGEYEIVLKWDPSNAKDNSQSGYTGNVYLDAYKLSGHRLWRIDLGRNIRAGAHYTQFIVYDLDGDGRAEVACKTADGTISGTGEVIGNASAEHRNASGYVLTGPEFLTVFDGFTGAVRTTVDYHPLRGDVSSWGDNYGNRVDRFLAGVAYLDGQNPSLIMCRGYYTRTVIVAWDLVNGQLVRRWVFDAPGNSPYAGQGNHQLSIADVDADGKQEIVYGAMVVDDDGSGLHNTGFSHGDALHVSDLNPDVPGLEIFTIQERVDAQGAHFRNAHTGAVHWSKPTAAGQTEGPGRAMAADIDPRHRGVECWVAGGGISGLFNSRGEMITASVPPSCNFAVWWDADLTRELLNNNVIDKWMPDSATATRLLTATGCASNNGTKATPALSGDILGDWREEVIWRTTDSSALRIYTTTIPANTRMATLMHDPQYRTAIAWQNVAYNQPPHPSFYLGHETAAVPTPNVAIELLPSTARPANLSVRTVAGAGAETLIVGFVVNGAGTQRVITRAVGPSLAQFGVGGLMANPQLELYSGSTSIMRNDDWASGGNASEIAAAMARVGAFGLNTSSLDAVLRPELSLGAFTAHVTPATGSSGVVLMELYAEDPAGSAALVNVSARALAGTGDRTFIAGFVLSGSGNRRVLLRAVGPSLSIFGVPGLLADPRIELYRGSTQIASNDNWASGAGVTLSDFSRVGAFQLPLGSKDAALLVSVPAGAYTVHVKGAGDSTGVALMEVYDLGE